ncbi:MAG: DNA alkylation repair protein [Gemmataceae bacterium]|nr:DNA alkylation repair protein [Gemmataceae bacterium]MCI0740943.1 DNA alkylation repair protein [Gemmataceae bacterium]
MTAQEIVEELKTLGNDGYKKTMLTHGAREPFFGVKIGDMKNIQKRVKKDYRLALDLYDTGIGDAQYLAGLIADDMRMTKKDLERWLEKANWSMLSEFTVPWVASGSPHGRELALKWIDSKKEDAVAAGWATLSSLVAIKEDADLDIAELKKLLERVRKTIHNAPNRVRYLMNGFVIAVGTYVKTLTEAALLTADKIGAVHVELVGDCKLPNAREYIEKVKERGALGKKRKSAKC